MSVERPHEDRLGTAGGAAKILTWTGTGTAAWSVATGGAPATADYLVGTAQGGLSAEIVVGATPGGELGGTWASPTVDATHAGSTHSASTDTHIADTSAAHAASAIAFTPNGSIAATDVQAAIQEVRDEASGSGIPATIVDVKGDLIAATAADTVARLAVGANDTILMADSAQSTGLKFVASQTPSTQAFSDAAAEGTADTYARGDHKHGMMASPGGGISSGTSNPGSPTNGDLFYRSDLDLLIRYRSTGTRWVTVQQYTINIPMQTAVIPISANTTFYGPLPTSPYDLWIESIYSPTQVQTTNDGSNFWTLQYNRNPSGATVGSSFTTSADGTGTATGHTVTVNALSGTTDRITGVSMIKTGSPGVLYSFGGTVFYRLVVT